MARESNPGPGLLFGHVSREEGPFFVSLAAAASAACCTSPLLFIFFSSLRNEIEIAETKNFRKKTTKEN
jgi:ABC-type glycerol-3-phosphate transport system permease component